MRPSHLEVAARAALLGACVVALAFGLLVPALAVDDTGSYLSPARSWAAGQGLGALGERLPLYPMALGLAIRSCGEGATVFALLNVALHLGAVLLVRTVLPRGPLRDLTAAATVVYPPLLTSAGLILQESLLALTISAVFVQCFRLLERPTRLRAGCAGLAIGLSALAKTTILPVAAAIALLLLLRVRRAALAPVVTLCAACAVVLVPWGVRNRLVHGHFSVTSGNGGLNVYGGTVSNNILPSWYTFPEYLAARARWEAQSPEHRPALDRYLYAAAAERIRADPLRWLALVLERALRFMLPARHWFVATGLSQPASFGPWYVLAIGCQAVLFACAGLLVLVAVRRRRIDPALAAAAVVFSHQFLYALSYSSPRYGMTIGPVLFGALAFVVAGADATGAGAEGPAGGSGPGW